MWSRIPICFWPSVWLASWLLGAATATAYRLPQTLVPLVPHRLRTPLLSLHVSTLQLNPPGRLKKPSEMRALRRIPAPRASVAN